MFYRTPTDLHRNRRGSRRAGFTFIEVMVVVVIIGMLAGAVTLKVSSYMDKSKINRAKADIALIVKAIEADSLDGQYPGNSEGLSNVQVKNKTDPWGNAYQYNSPGQEDRPYEVFSFGADGRPGGQDADADIYSWQVQAD
jgi:general secretion pathway protein G